MVEWRADSGGNLAMNWRTPDEFLTWFNTVVEETAMRFGYHATLVPMPKDEVLVDRV